MAESIGALIRSLANRRLGVMVLLGFASGLPLALTGGALKAWLESEGHSMTAIGLFSLVGAPYSWKFVWSPAMDRFTPPILGRRRGWILVTQILLVGLIATMGLVGPSSPEDALMPLAVLAVAVAFTSASQDIAFNAYMADVLRANERGLGAALQIGGYRLGMLVSGGVSFNLAASIGWQTTYLIMAGVMGTGILATLLAPPPERPAKPPRNLAESLFGPFREFFTRRGTHVRGVTHMTALLAVVVLYRLGDTYASSLLEPFLLRGVGFGEEDIGIARTAVGLAAVLSGTAIGGFFLARFSLFRALLVFGILQCVSNLAYMVLAGLEPTFGALAVAISIENLAGGMGTAALLALVMGLCHKSYTATQFALLTALSSVGRLIAGPTAGVMIDAGMDWSLFYLVTAAVALPGLALLVYLREDINALTGPEDTDDGTEVT